MNEHTTFILNTEETFNKLQEASEKKLNYSLDIEN